MYNCCDRCLKIMSQLVLLHLISCFNFNNKLIYFTKVTSDITNYIVLLIFRDAGARTWSVSFFCIESKWSG